MREGWQQQATQQNFGQAMSAAQLREQLQQDATQQGWSQAQTEAVFREQMAQQASQQGFSRRSGRRAAWQQGMAGQQFVAAGAGGSATTRAGQPASQPAGWSQAQAEAVFREQMAQQASRQGFNQALRASRISLRRGPGAAVEPAPTASSTSKTCTADDGAEQVSLRAGRGQNPDRL